MTVTGAMLDEYLLEGGQAETGRLRDQARSLAPATERLLRRAGLVSGMRCLDAGCGPGEGMRIMGRIVGPSGQVTGVDMDGATGEQALARLRAEEDAQFAFVEGDVNQLDQVTQQNAALVEESAAAAESLKQQAARLAETVAQFRV